MGGDKQGFRTLFAADIPVARPQGIKKHILSLPYTVKQNQMQQKFIS